MLYIGYLQFIVDSQGFFPGRDMVGEVCFLIKKLAMKLHIPVVLLSGQNRGVEHREGAEGKKPQLTDLYGSSKIEELADVVLMVHRPEYFHVFVDMDGRDLRGLFEVMAAKNARGPVGEVCLHLDALSGSLSEVKDTPDGSL